MISNHHIGGGGDDDPLPHIIQVKFIKIKSGENRNFLENDLI
jgi:hypothetical protein